jgi:hypothetical protein
MNLAHPAALFWAALAVPVVIFYLLKVRVRQLPIGAEQFWDQVFVERQFHRLWRRLRHPLSLLVQCVLLGLLVVALGEPFFSWEVQEARRRVLVLDNSASMAAAEGGSTRLELARREARRRLQGLRFRDDAAVVLAGARPQVVCGLTNDRRALTRAVDAVEPRDGSADLAGAVALARRLLAGHAHGQIDVLTDGCGDGLAELAKAPDVRLWTAGTAQPNVGITRFQARRSLRDPIGYEVLVEVGNFSDEPVARRLELTLDGRLVDVLALDIPANDSRREIVAKAGTDGGVLMARLDQADALAADDTAWALLPPREALSVALVSETSRLGDLYVEKVLEALPLVQQPLAVVPDPAKVPPAAVTVYHRRIPARLPPGLVIVLDPAAGCDLWDLGEPLIDPVADPRDTTSPLLADVKLDTLRWTRAQRLSLKGSFQVLIAAAAGEPLYAVLNRPEGKVLVLTADLDQADLPLRNAFPILMGNALAWLSGRDNDLREAAPAGAVVEITLPQGAPGTNPLPAEVYLWSPDGRSRRLPGGTANFRVGPLDRCGVWRISPGPDDPPLAEIACNLANRRESDLRPASLPPDAAPPEETRWTVAPIWYLLTGAVLVLAAVEWGLYQRRWVQ